MTTKKQALRGFSLVELVIVLGIAGIVVAGVTYAGSVVNRKVNMDQAVDEVGLISSNIRDRYTTNLPAGDLITPDLVCAGVFPSGMLASSSPSFLCNGVSKVLPVSPWGQDIRVSVIGTGTPIYYHIDYPFDGVPACVDFISHFMGTVAYQNSGPGEIRVATGMAAAFGPNLWGNPMDGVAAAVAARGCGVVRVTFKL